MPVTFAGQFQKDHPPALRIPSPVLFCCVRSQPTPYPHHLDCALPALQGISQVVAQIPPSISGSNTSGSKEMSFSASSVDGPGTAGGTGCSVLTGAGSGIDGVGIHGSCRGVLDGMGDEVSELMSLYLRWNLRAPVEFCSD